ncbi:protein ACTIVITY OF BC1 COMPLEX KINASE 8, chloroplastic [Telopea speciosissima]|uniref:protein ACTIVITY OF BC1 COMPLEX KINASE 8, chloroplastic n=1 Tax=Telopea speciosissima TaxID=54955 RepID=UPI001CC68265|nr:protein ACTIVITY OF BC1 COMPLEX KINASE 8, chloroplastic [Telopea speciosissima]XP_043718566.1 protein ACTIVITY OF BC1 COMPLEX KINASE 8, chloroplastic [Telopea speciosissima]XP_043718567.1 protein ACTIVITY OF BC1 COMPLEX KINASE 8, chloroplastic [Telopea speciosissima]XP_043718568.1 protein ACTIVITY OF BC1 COMPLEX KINASE 8, chloroplastic [Telopea speciosissima]XP_043718569.1 protein ACTIVITY OF BC1 COMPLEX KINASE 8, chloroplastic [Telopea speciosissima]XP_043718571.1 protein ACTIVITY OF BC1 C
MAASVTAASTIPLPKLAFLRPETSLKIRIPLSRLQFQNSTYNLVLRTRITAVREETVAVLKEKEKEDRVGDEVDGLNLNSNGSSFGYNGSVGSSNGSVGVILDGNGASNGSLVKYAGGNGAATKTEEGEVSGLKSEEGRKKRVEEIGQEEAWFKQAGRDNVEVSVQPGGRWNRFKTYSTVQRTLEIWSFVLTFLFKAWLNNQKFMYRGGMTEGKKVLKRKALAKWLKESILRLGPTFIKIGQQFSTRVDILAQEYVDQLSELQDQVPPFPSETAVSIIEEELGAPVDYIFDQFNYEPIAAASLGQVHRARLKGQEVVVKVQRPGLKGLFDIDLKNLRVIAEYLQKVDPKSDGAKRDWVAIYDECASVLYQEIDYTKEAENAELFAKNFKGMDYVKVPTMYWEYTTPQVLTMEYVPGIKINRIKALDQLGVDRQRLGRYAVESYLEQILSHGFFHADPHPGNIAVDDVNGGRLIFYDFGMMGSISQNIREGLLETFYGVYEKDPDKVLQAMIQMGVLVPTGDMTAVRRTAQFFLNSFEERLAAQRREREMAAKELGFKKPLSKEERTEKKKQRLAAIGEDLLAIAADQPFRFPATFTFVVRAFSVLDGIGKGLDPRFDITEIAKPYAMELLRFREAGVEVIIKDFKKRWNRQSRAFYNIFRQADRVEKLAEVIQRLEQGDLKLRVRTLESERAFQRVAAVQKTVGSAVAAGSFINLATILYLNSIRVPAITAYVLCVVFSIQVLFGILKVKKLDQQERLITGTA